MCKTICFRFQCRHHVKLRLSMCGGTFHKQSRSGKTVACSADVFLTINISCVCGSCQRNVWETSWDHRLECARLFLAHLKDQGIVGAEEIAELVGKLEYERDVATWDARCIFPPSDPKDVGKAQMGTKVRGKSPLAREVLPEEINIEDGEGKDEPVSKVEDNRGGAPELNSFGYPVTWTGTYDHPLDNLDEDWVPQEFVSQNDACDTADSAFNGFDSGFEFDSASSDWNTRFEIFADPAASWDSKKESSGFQDDTLKKTQIKKAVELFWDTIGPAPVLQANLQFITSAEEQPEALGTSPTHSKSVRLASTDFCEAHAYAATSNQQVHGNGELSSQYEQAQIHDKSSSLHSPNHPQTNPQLLAQFSPSIHTLPHILSLSSSPKPPNNKSVPPPSQSHPSPHPPLWTDGPSDPPPPPPSPPRRRRLSPFDQLRLHLQAIKPSDPDMYYKEWLVVCRLEARQMDNLSLQGRRIEDPRYLVP
ncbi:hypothetical protein CC78DRAFT_539400 [Lojkania enalia]|uniref:Uncharacterized protein n=1 Tax=Lojkania enalia TaxID=147567 RepID=A0A9P4TR96_9PLEO|nr:hypothetical protein CC78DRAFT_539400 [Didymosphaeria enalia]